MDKTTGQSYAIIKIVDGVRVQRATYANNMHRRFARRWASDLNREASKPGSINAGVTFKVLAFRRGMRWSPLTPEQQAIDDRIKAKAQALIDQALDLDEIIYECEAQITTMGAQLGAATRTTKRTDWLSGEIAIRGELLKAAKLAKQIKAAQ